MLEPLKTSTSSVFHQVATASPSVSQEVWSTLSNEKEHRHNQSVKSNRLKEDHRYSQKVPNHLCYDFPGIFKKRLSFSTIILVDDGLEEINVLRFQKIRQTHATGQKQDSPTAKPSEKCLYDPSVSNSPLKTKYEDHYNETALNGEGSTNKILGF